MEGSFDVAECGTDESIFPLVLEFHNRATFTANVPSGGKRLDLFLVEKTHN
jgi:hypothetical protein